MAMASRLNDLNSKTAKVDNNNCSAFVNASTKGINHTSLWDLPVNRYSGSHGSSKKSSKSNNNNVFNTLTSIFASVDAFAPVITSISSNKAAQRKEMEALGNTNQATVELNTAMEEYKHATKAQKAEIAQRLNQEINEANQEMSDLSAAMSGLNIELETTRAAITQANGTIMAAESEKTKTLGSIYTIGNEISALDAQIKEAETPNAEGQIVNAALVTQLKAQKTQKEARKAELETKVKELEKTIEEQKKIKSDKENRAREIVTELENKKIIMANLSKRIQKAYSILGKNYNDTSSSEAGKQKGLDQEV